MSLQANTRTSVFVALACWLLAITPLWAQQATTQQALNTGTTYHQQPQGLNTGTTIHQPPQTNWPGTTIHQQPPIWIPQQQPPIWNPQQQPPIWIPQQQPGFHTGTTIHQPPQINVTTLRPPYAPPQGIPQPGLALPVVGVTNQGPGNLMISIPNQNPFLLGPNRSAQLNLGNSVSLQAQNQNTNIIVKHVANGIAKWWDADEKKYTYIRPNQSQSYNLGVSVQGYILQKN